MTVNTRSLKKKSWDVAQRRGHFLSMCKALGLNLQYHKRNKLLKDNEEIQETVYTERREGQKVGWRWTATLVM